MIIEPQKSDREEARGRALVTHARRPPFPTSSTLSRKIRAPPPTPPPLRVSIPLLAHDTVLLSGGTGFRLGRRWALWMPVLPSELQALCVDNIALFE